jgi:hypothetical protein
MAMIVNIAIFWHITPCGVVLYLPQFRRNVKMEATIFSEMSVNFYQAVLNHSL